MRISDWSSDVCSSDRGVVAARAAKAEKAEVKPVAVAVNAPPLKPAILNGYVLKGISQAGSHVAAWIDTGKGLVKVSSGDKLNEAGVVREVRDTGIGWVVLTTQGLVVPR